MNTLKNILRKCINFLTKIAVILIVVFSAIFTVFIMYIFCVEFDINDTPGIIGAVLVSLVLIYLNITNYNIMRKFLEELKE